jgi:hypothetical protein
MGNEQKPVTLSDIVGVVVKDQAKIKQVLETAISRATEEYKAAGADAGTVPKAITALFSEPGATFLIDPSILPHDSESERNHLTTNPFALMVTLDWASAPKKESNGAWVVWFSIDPPARPIAAYATVTYKPKLDKASASSGVRVTEGRVTNNFWRTTEAGRTDWSDSCIADVRGDSSPPSMRNSVGRSERPPNKRNYYSSVTGGPQGGKYTISGGWRT